jgi:hypothetical protein
MSMTPDERTDARMRVIQAKAEQVLADCTRVLVPLAGWPRGGCFACGRVPDVRVSMRLDGEEMFWANVCTFHHDETYKIAVS